MNPNHATHTQTFLNLVRPTYGIGAMLGRSPLVWGPLARKFYDTDHAKQIETHRTEIQRLQAAWKKWPQWKRGGRGLTEAEQDACKIIATMGPEELSYVLSIRFPTA
jgi:hypothetical protein